MDERHMELPCGADTISDTDTVTIRDSVSTTDSATHDANRTADWTADNATISTTHITPNSTT